MVSDELAGRVALITGGASGIGRAVAEVFTAAGAAVAILDRVSDAADEAAATLTAAGATARAYAGDVSSLRDCERVVAAIATDLGRIDILVNNAGIATVDCIETMSEESWNKVLAVNLTGPFLCIRAALPHLKKSRGNVVMIASLAAKRASLHGGPNYTAAKAGLVGFARHAAFELAAYGVRINTVLPGPVLTPMVERSSTAEEREHTRRMVPLKRWVMPEDIAQAVMFFAGDRGKACTGSELVVDGGIDIAHFLPYATYFGRRGVTYDPSQGPQ